jgi:hypothetical protein
MKCSTRRGRSSFRSRRGEGWQAGCESGRKNPPASGPLGLVPGDSGWWLRKETLSGSSIKGKPRLCKIEHARLRKALYMPVLVSIQCNPVMSAFYNRLKEKGKKRKVIVCAVMRKLVHIIFGVLKSGKRYDPNYKPAFA